METIQYYEFGPFQLDIVSRSLRREGESLNLQPKTYEVLLMLIKNCNRIVGKDEIIETVWGVNVSTGVLNFQINQLRKILGDKATAPQYIQTYPKRGFRFIGNVKMIPYDDKYSSTQKGQEVGRNAEDNLQVETVERAEWEGPSSELSRNHLGVTSGTDRPLGGHLWHILTVSCMYAALFSVALLVEIAYLFDQYGSMGVVVALLIFAWVFATSVIGLVMNWNWGMRRGGSFNLTLLLFLSSTAVLYAGVCQFLPPQPITQLTVQAYTAQAAYLKTLIYFIVLAIFFILLPFNFIVCMQRDLRNKGYDSLRDIIMRNKLKVPPRGAIYPRLSVLAILLGIMAIVALFLHHNLMNLLIHSQYTNLFSFLIHLRLTLYFGIGLECLAWYYSALNELKREYLRVVEP